MRPRHRLLALVFAATYLAAALAPCAPARPASMDGRVAGPRTPIELAHGTHADHGAPSLAAEAARDAGAPGLVLTARCPCGCGKRPTAAAAPGALGFALLAATDAWIDPPHEALLDPPWPTLPYVTPRAIDHVPLGA